MKASVPPSRSTLLLLESRPEVRDLLISLLTESSRTPFTCLEAVSGEQALAALHTQRPDCILLGDPLIPAFRSLIADSLREFSGAVPLPPVLLSC